MIELMMFLAYALPALAVYRRAGYVWDQRMLGGHEFQSICNVCMPECKNCGDRKSYHRDVNNTYFGCKNFQATGKIIPFHVSVFFVALPFAILWPLTLTGFGLYAVNKKRGIEGSFLKPPPVIESKEEKMERRLAEAEAEIADTNKRLKELGIDL